jgi:uncharacterized membrane protein YsdA (DUF1294 family)
MAAATAIMVIVFMLSSLTNKCLAAVNEHARRIPEHNLIKINLIFLRRSTAAVSHIQIA